MNRPVIQNPIYTLKDENNIYLYRNKPIEVDGKTIVLDESAPHQPNRPTLYNRCLLGDGSSTINLSSGIVGTLTLKGWTKESGVWAYRNITTGLSGTTLTFQSSVYYKSIERYDNNVYKDTAVLEEGEGTTLYFNSGNTAAITTADINLVRVTQDDAPLLPESGDYVGWTQKKQAQVRPTDSFIWRSDLSNTSTDEYIYTTDENKQIWVQVGEDGSNNLINDIDGNLQGWVNGEYISLYNQNTSYGPQIFRIVSKLTSARIFVDIEIYGGGSIHRIDRWQTQDYDLYNRCIPALESTISSYGGNATNITSKITDLGHFYECLTDTTNVIDTAFGSTGCQGTDFQTALTTAGISSISDFIQNFVDEGLTGSTFTQWWFSFIKQAILSITSFNYTADGRYQVEVLTEDFQGNVAHFGITPLTYFQTYQYADTIIESYQNTYLYAYSNTINTDMVGYKIYDLYVEDIGVLPKLANANTDINGEALIYTGRKDQTLQVGGVAVNLDATATLDTEDCNKHIEYGTGVVATLGTIIAAYGEVADGSQIQVSDLGIDGDKVFNNRVDGQDIKLARIDWSNGVQSVYLGGIDNKGNVIASDKLYDASQVGGETATIIYDTQDYHTSQKYYNHWVVYGVSQDKVMLLKSSIAPTYTYISSNTSIINYNYFGKTLQFRRVADDGTTTGAKNDPNGDSQGWVNKSGVDYINIYCDYTAATNIAVLYPYTLPSGNISFSFIAKTLDNYPYVFKVEDDTLSIDFQAELDSVFGLDVFTKISTIQEFFEALNGGPPTAGSGFPNGIIPNYARDTLLINTTNGFDEDANSTNLCAAFTAACKQDGDASKLLQALYDSSEHDNTFAVNINHFKKVFSEVLTPSLDVLYEKNYTLSTLLSTGANNSRMYRFFQRYERIFYKFIDPTINLLNQTQTYWTYWKTININGQDLLAGLTDGSNTDSKNGQTNEYPYGIHLNDTQKKYVQLPSFKALEYAYQSNEEYWRNKVDSQGNAVLDRHLVTLSLEHEDSGFPAFVNPSADYFTITNGLTLLSNVDDSIRLRALFTSYTDSSYGTILGKSNNDNYILGFNGDNFAFRIGSDIINQDSGLDLSTLDPFILDIYVLRTATGVVTAIYTIYDLIGNVLSAYTETGLATSGNDFNTLFASNSVRNLKAEIPWITLEVNNVLTNWWIYTGNNSLLLQDKVGGNHGTLTTADVTLNQGTQDLYNPFEDGKNEFVYFNGTKYWSFTAIDLLPSDGAYFELGINNLEAGKNYLIGTSAGSYQGLEIDNAAVYIRLIYSGAAFFNSNILSTMPVETISKFRVTRVDNLHVTFTITDINGTVVTDTVTNNGSDHTLDSHPFSMDRLMTDTANISSGILRYFDVNGTIYDIDNPLDTNHDTISVVPQLPYNGTDVFGNTLTTPQVREVRKKILLTNSNQ